MNVESRGTGTPPAGKPCDDAQGASNLSRLEELVAAEAAMPVNADVEALVAGIARRANIVAVVFYGSGLWAQAGADTLYDFYVLVDRYRDWFPGRFLAAAGRIFPPNVYYIEEKVGDTTVRCKAAVMRRSQFEAGARGEHFTPQIWARFSQPCRVLNARDDPARRSVIRALADAVVTFHRRTLPLCDEVPVRDFWIAGMRSNYANEIRSEKPGRPAQRVDAGLAGFMERSRAALPLCGAGIGVDGMVISNIPPSRRRRTRRWLLLKRPLFKAVNFARLFKASFTFQGWPDYARWKIARHSGVPVKELTDFERRHPRLTGFVIFWKIVRMGGLR